MRGLATTLEKLLYQHRFALLWISYLVASATLLHALLSAEQGPRFIPYPLREMLINYADGIVRRGLGGELVLWAASSFGGSVFRWAFVISCTMAFVVFALAIRLYRRLPNDPALLPMVLAPWGLAFMAYDSLSSFRKEILGYIALLLILRACFATSPQRAMIWATSGCALLVGALFVHEGLVFIAPIYLLACALLAWEFPGLKRFAIGLGIVSSLAAAGVFLGLALLPLRDPALLCAAVADMRCGDPYAWVGRDLWDGIDFMLSTRVNEDLPFFALMIALATLPFLGFQVKGWSRRAHWLVWGACVIFIAPLFITAIDWGRWIHMVALPLSFLGLTAVALGKADYMRLLPAWLVLIYVGTHGLPHAHRLFTPSPAYIWCALLGLVLLDWLRGRAVLRR